MVSLNYPTKEHEKYILLLKDFCEKRNIGLYVLGSIAKGTAKKYSDIDIVIVSDELEKYIGKIKAIYEPPVMVNVTENPKGLLIVIYKSGLCIDVDLRKSISYDESQNIIEIVKSPSHLIIADSVLNRYDASEIINYQYLDWYSELRLIHRSLIKFLTYKVDSAYYIAYEIFEKIEKKNFYINIKKLSYVDMMTEILKVYTSNFDVEEDFVVMIEMLLDECKRIEAV